MISLEMAKKLKEAGLEWNPDIGDIFFYDEEHWDSLSLNDVINGEFKGEILDYIEEEWLFAPRLDQLLAEIEELGYSWFTETDTERYFIRVVEIKKPNNFHVVFLDTPEEAAAEALLWIYERRAATGCGLSDG